MRRFLGFNFGGEDLAVATEDVISELKRMEILGFTDAEVDRVVNAFRGDLDQFIESQGTRQDTYFASIYVSNFLAGDEIDDAESTYVRQSAVLDELTASDLTDHFRYLMSISAPLLVALGQDESDMPTVAELEAALARGLAVSIDDSDGSIDEVAISQLMATPDQVSPIDRNRLSDVDGFEVVFANGARGLFIESQIAEGQINLLAMGDGGWSVFGPRDAQLAAVATSAAEQSGLGELDSVQLNRFLDGSIVSLTPFIEEVDEGFVGSSATDDVELLFQLLHLSITAPRIDTAAFRSAIELAETRIRGAESDPATLSIVELFDARYGGSEYPRIVPSADALESFTAADALRIYRDRLGNVDDLVVAVVGDVDPDTIEELFERYVGSLPGGEDDSFVDLWPAPPAGIVRRTVTAGDANAGAGVDFLFTAEVDVDDRSALTAAIVELIVDSRLFDAVREELGASYGAGVFSVPATRPDEVIDLFVLASGDPDRLALITETILDSVHDLATNGPTPAEFKRAKAILSSDYELVNNFHLMTMLIDTARANSTNPFTRGEAFAVIAGITRAEVRSLAAELFPLDRWIQVTRTP